MGSERRARGEGRRAAPSAPGVGRRWVIGALGAGAVAVGGGWYFLGSARTTRPGNHPELQKGAQLPVTLSPALFVGKTAAAYQVAREIPETLAQIYCYCGCDKLVGHTSLLHCFSDAHASG
jgi:uncharacterized protein with PCYCGC motif